MKAKKWVFALLFLFIFSGCASWSKTDKALFGTFTAATAVDAFQTQYILKSKDYKELNPILREAGENGIYPYFLFTELATYLIADNINSKSRTKFLTIITVLEVGCVGRNAYLGIGFSF